MVSVIVPVYKVEKYLERCIKSIVNQTYKEIELIIVDDGSPDKCPEICDKWAEKDKRIKVIHKENGGLSDARNAGMQIASGEYMAFVDSDDWISPFYLEYLVKSIVDSKCDIVECDIIRTQGTGFEKQIDKKNIRNLNIFQTEEALKELIEDRHLHQYVWNKLYKRTVIQKIMFEKGKTNEDEFWTYQVFGNAKCIGKLNIPLYYYFQRKSSIMGEKYSLKRLDALEAKMKRQEYIEQEYPSLRDIAKNNLFVSCIYQGQMSLMELKGDQLFKAKKYINTIVKQIKPSVRIKKNESLGNKIWICGAKISFWGTCWLKNILRKGF